MNQLFAGFIRLDINVRLGSPDLWLFQIRTVWGILDELCRHNKRTDSPKVVRSFLGGDYGTRTCDLMRVKHAL